MIYRLRPLQNAPIYIRSFSISSCLSKNNRPDRKYQYTFYDLVSRTPTRPKEPIEASLMSQQELSSLKKKTSTTFEGNYTINPDETPEQRIEKVFGGRIKGESPRSSSRMNRGEPRKIKGILVPDKPIEPDNCCMSGCVNCVWELFNEDVKDWKDKRVKAASKMVKEGGVWPADFHPPVQHLKRDNLPESLAEELKGKAIDQKSAAKKDEEDSWGNVPVTIRVFAEMEKKMKAKKRGAKS